MYFFCNSEQTVSAELSINLVRVVPGPNTMLRTCLNGPVFCVSVYTSPSLSLSNPCELWDTGAYQYVLGSALVPLGGY